MFEIAYAPAVSPDDDQGARRRNWWANAREVMRVTKGKNVIVSGGASALADLRSPLDAANLYVYPPGLIILPFHCGVYGDSRAE